MVGDSGPIVVDARRRRVLSISAGVIRDGAAPASADGPRARVTALARAYLDDPCRTRSRLDHVRM